MILSRNVSMCYIHYRIFLESFLCMSTSEKKIDLFLEINAYTFRWGIVEKKKKDRSELLTKSWCQRLWSMLNFHISFTAPVLSIRPPKTYMARVVGTHTAAWKYLGAGCSSVWGISWVQRWVSRLYSQMSFRIPWLSEYPPNMYRARPPQETRVWPIRERLLLKAL